MGEKSARFLRSAGYKLAQELTDLMPRGCFGGAESELSAKSQSPIIKEIIAAWTAFSRPSPQLCTQGAEPQVNISGTNSQIGRKQWPVDFTRTVESVAKRGVDMHAILEKYKLATDLRVLLTPRERALEWDEAIQLMSEWNEELVEPIGPDLIATAALQQFTMIDGKWVPIEVQWFGHFFNQDSYIVIARYWDFDDERAPEEGEEGANAQQTEETEDRTKTVVSIFLWQSVKLPVSPSAIHLNSCFSYIVKVPETMLSSPKTGSARVWLWVGKKAHADDKVILEKLAKRIFHYIFRAQFSDWEEAMAVDFTRTVESVAKRGVDMHAILEKYKLATDLRVLLTPRERALEWDEAIQLMSEWNEELVEPIGPDLIATAALQQFTMIDGKWVPIEVQWFGHFFNQDSYIVIARYWDFDDERAPEEGEEGANAQQTEETEDRTKTVVYFWQGREASDLHWLSFNFSVRKDMEARLSINPNADGRPLKVEFKRVRQQQEDLLFLSHFQRQFIIHNGKYRDRADEARRDAIQMYYVRANGNAISTRSIEVGYFCASEKCSDFCQDDLADDDVMMLDTGDQIYVWWGKRTSDVEQKLSLQAAKLYQKHLSNVQKDRPRQLKLTAKNVEPHMFKRCFHGWGPFREPKDWSG
ncbi:hypothetical protein AHF37_01052 [Paragonimus kellicotti]|nr:hypothetical protein AHF37_01052 [Paragonimus kellicotti]